MDQTKHQNVQSLSQYITSHHFLKKATQFLISLSFFFFLHSLKYFYFSTFPFQLLTHALHKNYIFLICNGLLVFIAKTSGLLRFRSSFDLNDHRLKVGDALQKATEAKESFLEKEVLEESYEPSGLEKEEDDDFIKEENESTNFMVEEKELEVQGGEGGGESGSYSRENEDKEQEVENGFPLKEEEEEEEAIGVMSTEELNKKFDDFIRRMKEEIRIEAQQQLVMV